MMVCCTMSCLLLISLLGVSAAADQLVLVQSLFRHGARTPTGTYPTDPYNETFWGLSWGQLTDQGMLQHFEQGNKLRVRYVEELGFIAGDYKDFNVHVRSTDVDRTLMSAYAHLAGFYHGSTNGYPNDNSWPGGWTPVPVHTVDESTDHLLFPGVHCPRRDEIVEERKKRHGFAAWMASNELTLRAISVNSGINTNDFSSFSPLNKFYGSVSIEKEQNLTLPSWITDSLWQQYEEGKHLQDDFLHGNTAFGTPASHEIMSLEAGILLKTMIDNMDNAIAGSSKVKYFMYSAHDTTLSALMRALDVKQKLISYRQPDYAATILAELWRNDNGQYFVKFLYVPDVTTEASVFTDKINGCDGQALCALDAFKQRSQDYFISGSIDDACKKKNP